MRARRIPISPFETLVSLIFGGLIGSLLFQRRRRQPKTSPTTASSIHPVVLEVPTAGKGVSREVRERIVSEGQVYLSAQVSLATAADARSSALASVFITASAGLMAGVTTLATIDKFRAHVAPLAGAAVTGFVFFVAAALCIWSTSPKIFWLPGNSPNAWAQDLNESKAFDLTLVAEAKAVQRKIDRNNAVMQSNALLFRLGSRLGVLAPSTGILVWAIISAM